MQTSFSTMNSPPVVQYYPTSSNSNYTIIIFVVIVIILIVIGVSVGLYFYFKNKQNKENTNNGNTDDSNSKDGNQGALSSFQSLGAKNFDFTYLKKITKENDAEMGTNQWE